jgi:hypothetical protein
MTRNGRIALDPPSQPVLNLDDDGSLPNLMVDTYWAGGSDYRVHFSLEGGPSKLPLGRGFSSAERIQRRGDVALSFLKSAALFILVRQGDRSRAASTHYEP